MQEVPIPTTHLFSKLEQLLLDLLQSLTPEEWDMPTIAKEWRVKDVVAHLLDVSVRSISSSRDNYALKSNNNINSYSDLVSYLNKLNADWVNAMKRVSPQILLECMKPASHAFVETILKKDPWARAPFSVAWAGEEYSLNWFHVAREYTERWHHQQQIRDAVNKQGILSRELYYPVLDTFMRALPYTFRHTEAIENTVVHVLINGASGGSWFLIKKEDWVLSKENTQAITSSISIDESIAWKLFTRSWRKKDVIDRVVIEGDKTLANTALDMIAVMA